MALADLVLKTKVNMALVRDPRVSSLDIGVRVVDGVVTLTGDLDEEAEREAAVQIAQGIEGVAEVHNRITTGVGKDEETAELVTNRFLAKLDEAWADLPDQSTLSEANYLRWALWLIYKFRLPATLACADRERLVSDTMEQAFVKVAGYVRAPKALIGVEYYLQVERVIESSNRESPVAEQDTLISSPTSDSRDPTHTHEARYAAS